MSARRGSEYWGQAAGVFAVVFLAYGAGAVLSWEAFGATVGPAFFPPAGITVAALILSRRSLWPVIVVAILAAEFLADLSYGDGAGEIVGYAAGNAIEPLVGAALTLAWCRGVPDLRRRRDLMLFLAAACLAGPFAGGLVGGANISIRYGVWLPAAVAHWFAGDAIGVLVVAVPILLWSKQSRVLRARPPETVLILLVSLVVAITAYWNDIPPSMLVLPVLAWAALRLDMLGAAMAGTIVAFVANLMTVWGRGLFSGMALSEPTRLALTQVSISVNVLVALLIAQESAARVKATREREVERRERLRLETLSRLGHRLAASITPHDIGQAVVDQVINDAGAKALSLGLVSADGATLEWITMAGYPQAVIDRFGPGVPLAERSLASDAARTGNTQLIRTRDEYESLYPDMTQWVRISGTEAMAALPFSSGGEPIGVLVLAWSEPQPLDVAQLAYFQAATTLISQALVRARIYADEHARAAVLQAAVLPTAPADTGGLDMSVTYEPADVVQGLGGDWYDVMRLPKNRTYFAVGDVVGHGLPAVEDMAQLRSAGRAMAHQGLSASQLLAELNGFTRNASIGKFATMAVVVLDEISGSLSYASAGHPPCLLRRAATGEVIRLCGAQGPVRGPLDEVTYTESALPIARGDILVMYTDGLVENRGSGVDEGIARLERIVAAWDADTILSAECAVLQETLAPRPRSDDVCIIAVRFSA